MNDTKVEILDKSSITKTLAEIFHIDVGPSWMDEILAYKKDDTLPENKLAAQTLIRRATRYNIMEGKLYRQSLKFPHLKYITPEVGREVLNKTHGGDGGNHSGYRSLANKATRCLFRYIIVGIDYNSKWIEAVPLVKMNTHRVKKFIWKNICCRFGVPNTIITDNGAQFNNEELIIGRQRKSFRSGLPQWHIPYQTPSGSRQQENQDTA
ncbi:hypothetical protein ACLB2K_059742 [Fragaria x ananassa]